MPWLTANVGKALPGDTVPVFNTTPETGTLTVLPYNVKHANSCLETLAHENVISGPEVVALQEADFPARQQLRPQCSVAGPPAVDAGRLRDQRPLEGPRADRRHGPGTS
ncbi:hypothetical protein [Nocardioides sp.]|uniref:hypothetical protein n=1 Tax=Nocardioides sp. TaxID=35761 RepID=UPI002ED899DA